MLLILGYVTAVVTPKGWGFMSMGHSTRPQLAAFLGVMLPSEFLSVTLYASGGSGLRRFLTTERHLANLNKIAAGLMVLVAALMLFRIYPSATRQIRCRAPSWRETQRAPAGAT